MINQIRERKTINIGTELSTHKFIKDKEDKISNEKVKKENTYFKAWNKASIEPSNGTYHLISDGILRAKDSSFLFQNESASVIIPPEGTDTLSVYSNIVFLPNVFESLNKNKIALNMYDRFGSFVGSFIPANNEKVSETAINQMKVFCNDNERLKIARKIELAATYNIKANLKYYYKRYGQKAIKERIDEISELSNKYFAVKTVDELLIIEAKIRQKYFSCYDDIMDDDNFVFVKRSRRPPLNALNALISFGNTLLYQKVATEIRKSSLDIKIGFIHSPNRRSETLHLDITEIFKPIIVDRVIFSLVNKKMIDKNEHFEDHNGGVYLNKEGKKIFINAYYNKINSKITVDGEILSFRKLIVREINKLVNYINNGGNYIPYKNY